MRRGQSPSPCIGPMARAMAYRSSVDSGTSMTATFVRQSTNSAEGTHATTVTVRRSAIRTRRQDGRARAPRPRIPPECEPPGSKGAEPPLVSLQWYTLGSLAHVTGARRKVRCGADRGEPSTVARPQPFAGATRGGWYQAGRFDRFGLGEGGARHRRAGTDGARSRHRLPSHSLLNLRDGDVGLSFW